MQTLAVCVALTGRPATARLTSVRATPRRSQRRQRHHSGSAHPSEGRMGERSHYEVCPELRAQPRTRMATQRRTMRLVALWGSTPSRPSNVRSRCRKASGRHSRRLCCQRALIGIAELRRQLAARSMHREETPAVCLRPTHVGRRLGFAAPRADPLGSCSRALSLCVLRSARQAPAPLTLGT